MFFQADPTIDNNYYYINHEILVLILAIFTMILFLIYRNKLKYVPAKNLIFIFLIFELMEKTATVLEEYFGEILWNSIEHLSHLAYTIIFLVWVIKYLKSTNKLEGEIYNE